MKENWEKYEELHYTNRVLRSKLDKLEDKIEYAKDFLLNHISEEIILEAFGENEDETVLGRIS